MWSRISSQLKREAWVADIPKMIRKNQQQHSAGADPGGARAFFFRLLILDQLDHAPENDQGGPVGAEPVAAGAADAARRMVVSSSTTPSRIITTGPATNAAVFAVDTVAAAWAAGFAPG